MSLPLDPHIKFVEGWLQLFLGMVQIIFATAALTLPLTVGLEPMIWVFVYSGRNHCNNNQSLALQTEDNRSLIVEESVTVKPKRVLIPLYG